MFRPMTIVRRVKLLSGSPRMRVVLRPRFDWGRVKPEITQGSTHLRFVGPDFSLRLNSDVPINYLLAESFFVVDRPMNFILGPDETLTSGIEDTARGFEQETVAYWRGWTIARDVILIPGTHAGYVLEGYGGLHPFSGAPALNSNASWPGWDIARSVWLLPTSTLTSQGGYVLDGYGGMHAFGTATPVTQSPYWPGQDLARNLTSGSRGVGCTCYHHNARIRHMDETSSQYYILLEVDDRPGVLARVARSRTDFKQIFGRGTRVRDDYGKLFFSILDYTGSVTRKFADPDFDGEPLIDTVVDIDEGGEEIPGTEETVEEGGDGAALAPRTRPQVAR